MPPATCGRCARPDRAPRPSRGTVEGRPGRLEGGDTATPPPKWGRGREASQVTLVDDAGNLRPLRPARPGLAPAEERQKEGGPPRRRRYHGPAVRSGGCRAKQVTLAHDAAAGRRCARRDRAPRGGPGTAEGRPGPLASKAAPSPGARAISKPRRTGRSVPPSHLRSLQADRTAGPRGSSPSRRSRCWWRSRRPRARSKASRSRSDNGRSRPAIRRRRPILPAGPAMMGGTGNRPRTRPA